MSALKNFTGRETLKFSLQKILREIFQKPLMHFKFFLTDYYRRVKTDYNLDFDTFMIIVVVLQHGIYEARKMNAQIQVWMN